MDVRICAVFMLLVLGGTFALTRKGFFCRDPDTGKLYALNTTWRSTTFCGNYTCKLRMKDIRNAPPIREFKVSNVNLSDIKPPYIEKLSASVQEPNKTDEEKRISIILNKIMTNINEGNNTLTTNSSKQSTTAQDKEIKKEDKTDRYLTDKEIQTIARMLQSVKKSDLEAVVDIYNLAQDIYKELDKKTSENLLEETVNDIQTSGISNIPRPVPNKITTTSTSSPKQAHGKSSYWYEPLINSQKVKPLLDLNGEGSDIVPSVYTLPKYHSPPAHNALMSYQHYGRQPFFYDLSDFQRQLSYVHATSGYPSSSYPSTQDITYSQQDNSYTQQATEKYPTQTSTVLNPTAPEKQQVHQPLLMPFPYYQVHYNTYNASGYPYQYYYGVDPYNDVYRKEYNRYYVSPAPIIEQGSVPEKQYEHGSLLGSLLPIDDTKTKKPDWKTDSLSNDVIEDIRGHFEKNILFKPLCLRKKVKLEKVGKVFKLEDLNRDKRSISEDMPTIENDDMHFEAYIERTTCQSDVDPGFFRMGNDTAPYPACCPQRISR